jgi:beta-galactosidase
MSVRNRGPFDLLALALLLVAVFILPHAARARGPAAQATARVDLDGKWAFRIDPSQEGTDAGYWATSHDDTSWDRIEVPGVWDTYDRYHDYTGDAWYRFAFDSDQAWSGQNVRLVFDSVYHDSEIWLNGRKLGENNLGWIPFSFDVEEHLAPQGQKNVIALRVSNRFKRGAVWNWGGIRRPVYLEVAPQTRIERLYVTPTPDLKTGRATVAVRAAVANDEQDTLMAGVDLRILRNGAVVSEIPASGQVRIVQGSTASISQTIELPREQVALWHFNDPNLYSIEATLRVKGKPVHSVSDRFGIRKVEVKGEALFLNGEKVRLVGLNMVPEDRFSGNALPLSRIKEDVDLLKSMSANFARLSGPVLPKEYVSYLDEVGFLLVEEVGLWGKDRLVDPDHPLPRKWLERLIDDHYNHPSVIAWSVGNEIGDLTKNPKANKYVKAATEHARKLDPTRLAVYISYSADFQENDPAQYSDIVMFNKYSDHAERLEVVHKYYGGKPIFFSEIGASLDSEDPNLSFIDPPAMMADLRKYPYLIGTSYFAFSDYRSNWIDTKPAWTTPVSENRTWGVLNAYRKPKRAFYKLQQFYAPVETFDLTDNGADSYMVHLKPRGPDTFPSYSLEGYQVAWVAKDADGKAMSAGVVPVPRLVPGATLIDFPIRPAANFARLSLNLLDPSGYRVLSTNKDLLAPRAPKVTAVHTSVDTIRVTFEPSPTAAEHQLIAIAPDGTRHESPPTINDFAEIAKLSPETRYTLELRALNGAGANAQAHAGLVATTSPDELPPVIWDTFGRKDAFHIGFSSDIRDFRYEIRYGLKPGGYTRSRLIETHGATRVPAIEPGAEHYFQLRRLVRGSVDSEWTSERKVALEGGAGLPGPANAFAIRYDGGIVIALDPVSGATGYIVSARDKAGLSVETRLAYSAFINLESAALRDASDLTIATLDNDGKAGVAVPLPVVGKQANWQ